MTLDSFRHPPPSADDASRARVQLEDLFSRPSPPVSVIVKKRRLAPATDARDGTRAHPVAASAAAARDDAAVRGPKVHRLTPPSARPTADAAAAASTGAASRRSATAPPQPSQARRKRLSRDPLRRPSPVHVVLQAPAQPARPHDEPAWRRILCTEPQEVSYGQVQQALLEAQSLVEQARRARRFQLAAQTG